MAGLPRAETLFMCWFTRNRGNVTSCLSHANFNAELPGRVQSVLTNARS